MVQVFLLVVLGVDRLTKACSFCNCLTSDLQESRKWRLAQQLDLELHTSLHLLQPGTGNSPAKRNSLPHHTSCQTQQDKLTCSASAAAAPSSPVHGFQLCRLPPFPGRTRGVGEKQRDFVGQHWRLHISYHLWVAGADKICPGLQLVSPTAKPREHHLIPDMRSPASPAEKQLISSYGCSLLAAHQPCRSVTVLL